MPEHPRTLPSPKGWRSHRHIPDHHDSVPGRRTALWHWPIWQVTLLGVVFGSIELVFFSADLAKVSHGGCLTLLIAIIVFTVLLTWRDAPPSSGPTRGTAALTAEVAPRTALARAANAAPGLVVDVQ
ncbi:KUP/HAK/KT family potassium transporter [Micromonospora sp. NPDC004540]|uniref:KUP/HAK/KT family potassium transporter n=1 Tax=Micromonospora sp. NPDC004540 TaxID=3154457 RepID=UPI0033A5C967